MNKCNINKKLIFYCIIKKIKFDIIQDYRVPKKLQIQLLEELIIGLKYLLEEIT